LNKKPLADNQIQQYREKDYDMTFEAKSGVIGQILAYAKQNNLI